MSKRSLLLAATLAATPLQSAIAQSAPSVSASVSGYTAIGVGAIPQSEWESLTTTRNDGPLHAETSGNGGRFISIPVGFGGTGFIFTSASAVGFASADPGVLHIYGSDLAIAQPGIIGPNLPPAENGNTVYTNIQAAASFTDYLTVDFPGRAAGTPVQVPFRYLAEVVSDTVLGYPPFSQHPISVAANFNITGIAPQNFSTETNPSFFRITTLPNGNFLHVVRSDEFNIDAHVGDILTIGAAFSIFGQANITDSNRQVQFGAFADGRDTAAIWLGNLPSGLVITSASGHDYTIDPTAAVPSVPIPTAIWLFGSTLAGLTGFGRRKSRAGC